MDVDEKQANNILRRAYTIFKTLKAHTQFITDNAVATSAMLQAVSEKFPDVAEKYEKYRKTMSEQSPIALKNREICVQFDVVLDQLEQWKN